MEWIEAKNKAKPDTYGQNNICQIPGCIYWLIPRLYIEDK